MRKNFTLVFLIALLLGYLTGSVANIYFIFIPSGYASPAFKPHSLWDWTLIVTQSIVVIYLLFIAQKVKDNYAKKFWLFLSAVCLFGIVKGHLILGTRELFHMISALECISIFLILLIFLSLYHKNKFDLFVGLKKKKT